jgi:replication factor C small subunit
VSHNCNYPSKIIPPIQSRCAIFRFSPLKKEDIAKKLKEIAEKEGLNLTESGLEAIIYVSEGDMRKAINVLQTAAALSDVIDDEIVYKVSSRARPEEVKKMMQLALNGKFIEARDLLYKLMVEWGMSGEDILNQMFREINNLDIDERKKVELAEAIGETDFRIVEGANERIQLSALLAKMALMGR